jgi:hypothetical protein
MYFANVRFVQDLGYSQGILQSMIPGNGSPLSARRAN